MRRNNLSAAECTIGVRWTRSRGDAGFDDIEDDGVSWLLSYQRRPGKFFRWEIDLEYFDDGFGGSTESAFAPIVYVLAGKGLYGGLGIGVIYSDGLEDEISDPFYAARAGFTFPVLPKVQLDVHGNYRFDAWDALNEADTESITLGAIVRVKF